ncbi:MAG: GTPase HflX [Candidatus Anoxychlamydiales bacterium]|nr:GTPase HflX [Candidatus Anoxychlamydiales bacterium]
MSTKDPIDLGKTRLLEIEKNKNALLVGAYKSNKEKNIRLEHLEELKSLATTFGLQTIEKMLVHIRKIETSTYIGSGKVEEIRDLCEEKNIDIVIFDIDIAPHQQRNLEREIKKTTIDRTELILGVFAIHARSNESKLQVKLAQFKYEMPRLKRMWTHLSRQRTGGKSGGYLKGAGEKQIEIDRQIIKKKISDLQKDIDKIKEQRELQRKKRKKIQIPSFAIIGYTNSGKSTLMNALTDAKVLVEDKLFATLDTTTRKYTLPNQQQVVVTDTVGFIRKLPHTLIAAFKSTLEEAISSDILIHLVDVSNENAKVMAEASIEVLKELKADEKPIITCLNKIDEIYDQSFITYFKLNYPKTVIISALKKEGFEDLMDKMIGEISNLRKIIKLKIPQSYYKLVSEIIKEGRIISLSYEENDILIEAEIPKMLQKKLEMFIA